MRSLSIGLAVTLTLVTLSVAHAAQYNKRPYLPPGAQAKISRVIAKAGALGRSGNESPGSKGSKASQKRECGKEQDGVIVDKQFGQKTIVVTKDIVNRGGNIAIASDCD